MSDLLARVRAEIDSRLADLRPAVAEHQQLLEAAATVEAEAKAARAQALKAARPLKAAKAKARRPSAPRRSSSARAGSAALGAPEQAILAALEHGSHTVAELGVVTAMPAAEIRTSLKRLLKAGRVQRAKREGRAAYASSAKA
jgi:predicted Rossmann fold nucleotide-binding protein DprA/Smf involved in DNA uptake